jgi:hypothetical protein
MGMLSLARGAGVAQDFHNQARLASLLIKLVVSAILIGLEDNGISVRAIQRRAPNR